jgi:predicted lipid carrier protein YhbT
VSVTLSAEDLVAVADGKYDGRLLVASERIVVEGDQDLALAMGALFSDSTSD